MDVEKGNDCYESSHVLWVGHSEKAFNPATSCCTLPFPRVTGDIVFLSLHSPASHHYTFTSIFNHVLCKFISWANEIFPRKLVKPHKLIQHMSVKKVS